MLFKINKRRYITRWDRIIIANRLNAIKDISEKECLLSTKEPRINTLVQFINPFKESFYPFEDKEILLYLGEVKNMKGHCIVANKEGKIFWGYHIENFKECGC